MYKDFAEDEFSLMVSISLLSSYLNQDVHAIPHIFLAVDIVKIRPLIYGMTCPMSCFIMLDIL
jgi:hypothetical protein